MNRIEKDTINAKKIIEIVGRYFDVDNKTKCRKLSVMIPRQISQYFIRRKLELNYQLMASIFNVSQHGTISNNVNNIENYLSSDPEISFYVKELELILRDDVEIMLYQRTLDNVEVLTSINKILDSKSVYDLNKIKKILLDYNTKIQ